MSITRPTTRSSLAVARQALATAERSPPAYSSPRSRHDYTQHQLFAALALKQFFFADYRGIAALLADSTDLRAALRLARLPHFSTLANAAPRLLKGWDRGRPRADRPGLRGGGRCHRVRPPVRLPAPRPAGRAVRRTPIGRLLGDAGYDAEHHHALCRERLGIREAVFALNRRNSGRKWPTATYRRSMRRSFPRAMCRLVK